MTKDWFSRSKSWKQAYASSLKGLYGGAIEISIPTPKVPTAKIKNSIESEKRAQERIVAWLTEIKVPFYAIPNGAHVTIYHRQSLVRSGLKAGVPDLCIPRAKHGYHGLYIEMKRADGGNGLSDVQKEWLKVLSDEGYLAVQCNGYDETRKQIEWYLC